MRSFVVRKSGAREFARFGGAFVGAAMIGVLAGGCSTTLFTQKTSHERDAAIEHAALRDAASAVSETKWPKPDAVSWRVSLTSIVVGGSERVSQADAVDAYLGVLGDSVERRERVFADAERHLGAARNLAMATIAAAASIRPVSADVSVVEDAIGDLRQTREIYLASLKTLAKQGEPVEAARIRDLKYSFNAAIEDIGSAADSLADSVASDITETFASPATRHNLDGSL